MPSATAAVADQRHQPPSKRAQLQTLMEQRILLLDGAYGTAFQGYQLEKKPIVANALLRTILP